MVSVGYETIRNGILAVMEWTAIREAFKAARAARKLDQHEVAGLPQAMISKIEMNNNLGPTVGTFVKAVLGLGIPVSAFFLQIESGLPIAELAGHDQRSPDLSKVADDDALQFRSEAQIEASVLRYLGRLALKGLEADESKRPTNYRLPPEARPHAAERSKDPRTRRTRHVPAQKKKRQR